MNAEKWNKLKLKEQMGNIGSEFFRMIILKQKGETEYAKNSLVRFLELIDLTIAQRKSFELLRLREIVCDIFLNNVNYKVSEENLKKYFLEFALNI